MPPRGEWQIQVILPGSQEIAFTGQIPAAPVPMAGGFSITDPELPSVLETVDRPDPAIYGVDAFYPAQVVTAGPVQIQNGRHLLPLRVYPFQWNPVQGGLRYHPEVEIRITVSDGGPASLTRSQPLTPLALALPASLGAVRMETSQRGLHRVTYADLLTAGVSAATLSDLDTASLALTVAGQPVAIQVLDGGNGRLEAGESLIFYAEPYTGIYMARNVYRLAWGGAAGPRMATRSVFPASGDPEVTQIYQSARAEVNADYRSDFVLPPRSDRWFDRALSVNNIIPTASRTYALALDDLLTTGTVTLRAAFFGTNNQPPNPDLGAEIFLNSRSTGIFRWEADALYTATVTAPASWLDVNPAQVLVRADVAYVSGVSAYLFSPNWVEATYPALADAEEDRLYIQALAQSVTDRAKIVVTGFSAGSGGAARVYDVRNPRQPVQLTQTQAAMVAGGGYTLSFVDDFFGGASPPAYALSAESALFTPAAISLDPPSAWRSPSHTADYIAIIHPSLWDAAQPLIAHRAAQGLQVAQVNVQDIYDEFSHGLVDPEAIRSFLTYAYHNWNSGGDPPAYVLLVGDGHYDFIGASASGRLQKMLIPPYLVHVDPVLGEAAADNRYVSVDGPDDYLPDMAIGRIPAQTPQDLSNVVNKILAYEAAPPGEWQERVFFVADSATDPAGNFHAISNDIRFNWLPAGYDDRTIYYGADVFNEIQARAATKSVFDNQALMIQWFGHASVGRWGVVRTLSVLDVPGFVPVGTWPVAMHYSCLSGNFSYLLPGDPGYKVLAETLLLSDQRGSVADIAPTGYHIGAALAVLNQGIVKAMFQDRVLRAGDVLDAGKAYFYANSAYYHDVIDTTVLLGDPALVLRLPPPPAQAPTPSIALASAGGVTLTWPHLDANAGGYEVWRSPRPYFTPGEEGSQLLATLPTPTGTGPVTYTDSSASGAVYYVVRGINRVAERSGPSARVGRFVFPLAVP